MIIRRIGRWPSLDWRSPFEELERMRREMDRLFEGLTGGSRREPRAGLFPLTNVTEDAENFYVRAELPGVKPDDLDISITGHGLSISGDRKIPSENEKATYHRRERDEGKFSRMIDLGAAVDAEKVEAHCTDGVLTVVLPKAESAKPKQITVRSAS